MAKNKVIVIEDDDIHYFILGKLLKDLNYDQEQIIRCSRIEEIYNINPDEVFLVLSDLVLPDTKRGTTFEKVAAHFHSNPIIVLTSSFGEEMAEQTRKQGAKGYLIKGKISSAILKKAIDTALGTLESSIAV